MIPLVDPAVLGKSPFGLVGCGVEGLETLRFLLDTVGIQASAGHIHLFDAKMPNPQMAQRQASLEKIPAAYQHWGKDWSALQHCHTIVRSPGVHSNHPALQKAAQGGAVLTSAIEWFLRLTPSEVIGVTGSLGKGTTLHFIHAALGAAKVCCHMAGNIGLNPLSLLPTQQAGDVTALELSSFQLLGLRQLPAALLPRTAVLLRVHPEHLDWHQNLPEYLQAKSQLLRLGHAASTDAASTDAATPSSPQKNQHPNPQRVVYCADSPYSAEVLAWANQPLRAAHVFGFSLKNLPASTLPQGIYAQAQHLYQRVRQRKPRALFATADLRMLGRFNLENASAAWLAIAPLITPLGEEAMQAALQAMLQFGGWAHHLEYVHQRPAPQGGMWRYYNDSFSTRPQAAIGALETFEWPLVMLLGGSDKGVDFSTLAQALCQHEALAGVVLMGITAPKIAQALHQAAQALKRTPPPVQHATTLAQAIGLAEGALPQGGAVVLSPACASFDMFANYKARGDAFCALVGRARPDVRAET